MRESPSQVKLAFESYKQLLQKSWKTVNDSKDPKTAIQGMSLIKDIVNSQLELVTNVNVIDNILNIVDSNNDNDNSKNRINPISIITDNDNDTDDTDTITTSEEDTEVYEEDEEEAEKQLNRQ